MLIMEFGSYENMEGYYIELKENEKILISRHFETKNEINCLKKELKKNYKITKVIENY